MLGTSVPVQNETFSSHAETAEKQRRNDCGGVFHRSFSFVLPPTERYWYWHFSGSSTADESFTHSGSSDSHGAQSDGGKNKQLWFHQVFPPLWMAFLPLSLLLSLLCLQFFESTSLHPLSTRSSSVLCSVTSKHGSTVSPMVCWEAFHLVSPANLDLCNYACLYVSADLDLCVFFCQTEGFFSLHPFVPPGFLPPLSNLSELRQCLTFFWLCQEVIFSCIYLLYFVC